MKEKIIAEKTAVVAVVPCRLGVDVVRMLAEQNRCDPVAESLAGVNSTAKTAQDAFMPTRALISVVQQRQTDSPRATSLAADS